MCPVSIKTQQGGATQLDDTALKSMRSRLAGALCLAGEPGYDDARTIWNAMIDRHPAAIVRAKNGADAKIAIDFARERGLLLAVRGGGHNIAGNAVCEGGLMLDLSLMKEVRVDPKARTARVEPGATLADVDRATAAAGLAVPTGINSTTGIAGLTLGGGFGWLSRSLGLTADNLLSAEVITADGKQVTASEKDHADLFWALRGGGGNFGVVTAFTFRLHPVGPELLSGLIVYPAKEARAVLDGYRRFTKVAPEELTCWAVLRKAPPLPFLPEEVHGKGVVVLALCYAGDPEKGKKAIEPLRGFGKPVGEHVGVMPFADWQQAFDPLLTPGARNYWKSHDFTGLPDGLIDVLLDYTDRLPGPECEAFIGHLGAAVNRVPIDATAYPHRNIEYVLNVHTRWREAKDDASHIAWAREFFAAVAPFATGGVYVNFMPEDEAQRVAAGAYGPNYPRLTQLKKKYDPENLFRLNQNIASA